LEIAYANSSESRSAQSRESRDAIINSLYDRRATLLQATPSDIRELELAELSAAIDYWEAADEIRSANTSSDRAAEFRAITAQLLDIQSRLERGF